eukprot:IDg2234t1
MKYQRPKLSEKSDVLLFSKQHYKVHADIGYTENLMWPARWSSTLDQDSTASPVKRCRLERRS